MFSVDLLDETVRRLWEGRHELFRLQSKERESRSKGARLIVVGEKRNPMVAAVGSESIEFQVMPGATLVFFVAALYPALYFNTYLTVP